MPTTVRSSVMSPCGPRENFGRAAISIGALVGRRRRGRGQRHRARHGRRRAVLRRRRGSAPGEGSERARRVVTAGSGGSGGSRPGPAQGASTGTGAKPAGSSSPAPKAVAAARSRSSAPGPPSRAAKVGRTATAGSPRRPRSTVGRSGKGRSGAAARPALPTMRGSDSPASGEAPERRPAGGRTKPRPSVASARLASGAGVDGTRSPGRAGAVSVRPRRVLTAAPAPARPRPPSTRAARPPAPRAPPSAPPRRGGSARRRRALPARRTFRKAMRFRCIDATLPHG